MYIKKISLGASIYSFAIRGIPGGEVQYLTMGNTRVLGIVIFSTVSTLLAIGIIILRYNTVTSLRAQVGSLTFSDTPKPKAQRGPHQYGTSDLEQRVSERYTLSNFTDTWNGIVNSSLPDIFLAPGDIPDKPSTVLIYVHSTPTCFARRELIRRSWGSREAYNTLPWKFQPYVIFVLGINVEIAINASVISVLEHENEMHHDILLYDFVDSYRNLTSKGFLAMSWIDAHFDDVKYILKTDDDILLNSYEWLYQIHLMDVERCKMCICCSIHQKLRRKPYPHCKGRAYILSLGALRKILSEYKQAKWNVWDDVYFTGDLGYQKGVSLHDTKNFSSTAVKVKELAPEIYDATQWERTWSTLFEHYQNIYANMSKN